jgi:hypothetical protein
VKQKAGPLEGGRLYFLTGEWILKEQIRRLWDQVRQGFGAFSPEALPDWPLRVSNGLDRFCDCISYGY